MQMYREYLFVSYNGTFKYAIARWQLIVYILS